MNESFQNIVNDYLKKHEQITSAEAFSLFNKFVPGIKKSTVNWRLHELVQRGVIKRAGRGVYLRGQASEYHPFISEEIKTLSQTIRSSLPLINYCVWSTDSIQEFAQHISRVSYIIVEVEKDGESSVLNLLKENLENVYNGNSKLFIQEILPDLSKAIIVKSLTSEAPIKIVNDVPVPLPEKILVDIYCDLNLYEYLQGNELYHIYQNYFDRYTINKTKLLRYAGRRGKKKEINENINQIIGNK